MPVATNHGTAMIIKMYVIRPPIWRGTRPSLSITRAKVPAPFAKFNHNLFVRGPGLFREHSLNFLPQARLP
jgi:hypothetical protein